MNVLSVKDLCILIFLQCDLDSIRCLSLVCKSFENLLQEKSFWKKRFPTWVYVPCNKKILSLALQKWKERNHWNETINYWHSYVQCYGEPLTNNYTTTKCKFHTKYVNICKKYLIDLNCFCDNYHSVEEFLTQFTKKTKILWTKEKEMEFLALNTLYFEHKIEKESILDDVSIYFTHKNDKLCGNITYRCSAYRVNYDNMEMELFEPFSFMS